MMHSGQHLRKQLSHTFFKPRSPTPSVAIKRELKTPPVKDPHQPPVKAPHQPPVKDPHQSQSQKLARVLDVGMGELGDGDDRRRENFEPRAQIGLRVCYQ